MSSAEPAQPVPTWPRLAPLMWRRMAFLCAAVTIAVLPLIFTDTYWRTNLILCALNVMLAIGLDFVLGYTYSHAIDDLSSNWVAFLPMNSAQPSLERGNSDGDIRHRDRGHGDPQCRRRRHC